MQSELNHRGGLENEGNLIPRVSVQEYLTDLPKPPPFFYISKRGQQIYDSIGLFLIEKRALVDSDITSLLLFAAKLDEYLEYDELIKLRNNKRKFSGSIQQFKSGADALTALFVARSKTMKELLVLMKELNLTPRARAQSKQALVNPNQLPFDFESIRNALNTGSI